MKQKSKMIKKSNLYLIFVFIIVLLITNIYSLNKYFIYDKVLNHENNIEYTYLDKTRHSGGKGEHYDMRVNYRGQLYRISITYKIFKEIEEGEFPELFITPQNEVITNWNMTMSIRGIITSGIGLLICIFILIYFKIKG